MDRCSIVNSTGYPTLWIQSTTQDATAFPLIASGGVLSTFAKSVISLGSNVGATVVSSGAATSSDPLTKYMASAGAGGIFKIMLPSGGAIIDSYIAPQYRGPYTYATPATALQDSAFYVATDMDSTGSIIASPASIVGKLVKDGNLLTLADTQNLISIYNAEKTTNLTPAQLSQQSGLETKNLRFFGAFLAEYCFYRSRYLWLLSKYFSVYTTDKAKYVSPPAGSPVFSLFAGQGAGPNQYGSVTALSQADYLKGITYHLASINTRMTDMKRLLTNISTYYNSVYKTLQGTLNSTTADGSNAKLTDTIKELQASTEASKQYMQDADFRKGVIEYTEEKNRYSSILLGLYAFLNISAIAVVFHLSKK